MAPKSTTSGASAGKRKAGPGASNGRGDAFQQKRAKIIAARHIPAQPAEAALKDGELDLQAFVAAHEFEIRSLEQSMAASKAAATSRAFQQVPRGMRRRTASHNPKRVPMRLRARAKREMAEDNTPTVEARRRKPRTTRAKIRAETARRAAILDLRKKRKRLKDGSAATDAKGSQAGVVTTRPPRPKIKRDQLNEPHKPAARFRKRQIHKTWLPTHLWHTKRARMTEPKNPYWRFAIPLTPNEKVYRPAHRAQGDRGALVWDTSYMSTIRVFGRRPGLERVLKGMGVTQDSCWNDKGRHWRAGTRTWNGLLSRQTTTARRHVCPAVVLWGPGPCCAHQRRGRDKCEGDDGGDAGKAVDRQVFVRVHPSAFLETFTELLRLAKSEKPRIHVEDLRFEIGSIELTGPASTEALLATMTPFPSSKKPKEANPHGALFTSLTGLTNPAALPANAVLGFPIQDPRLRYPPRRVESPEDEAAQMALLETISRWPAQENLQPYGIFDRDVRHRASCLPSQKALNARRSRAEPGKPLEATDADPPIPVVLIASRSGSSTQPQGTWTVLAPWKCILPLWYSLVHVPLATGGNPQFAGLFESAQVAFERGLAHFPADFPGTDAGAEWELAQRAERRRAWDRRPKSKRVEWSSLDLGAGRKGEVGDGLGCDFEFLFGLPPAVGAAARSDKTVGANVDAMDIDEEQQPASMAALSTMAASASSLKLLSYLPKTTFNTLLSPSCTTSIPPYSVITAQITIIGRGVVRPGARVYRLPTKPDPIPASSDTEVPASIPPEASSSTTTALPHDLRDQWIARASPADHPRRQKSGSRVTRDTDLETRKKLLAKELTAPPLSSSLLGDAPVGPPNNQHDIGGGQHPLVPDTRDLVGFVTTGTFSLSKGRGVAIASLAAQGVLPGLREKPGEGRLCVVRNAGENVGWVARWEVI